MLNKSSISTRLCSPKHFWELTENLLHIAVHREVRTCNYRFFIPRTGSSASDRSRTSQKPPCTIESQTMSAFSRESSMSTSFTTAFGPFEGSGPNVHSYLPANASYPCLLVFWHDLHWFSLLCFYVSFCSVWAVFAFVSLFVRVFSSLHVFVHWYSERICRRLEASPSGVTTFSEGGRLFLPLPFPLNSFLFSFFFFRTFPYQDLNNPHKV